MRLGQFISIRNFFVSFGKSEVSFCHARIIMELVSVHNNILQVVWLLNNFCEDCLEILKTKKMSRKEKKK